MISGDLLIARLFITILQYIPHKRKNMKIVF